jgi:replicative DNA helicase
MNQPKMSKNEHAEAVVLGAILMDGKAFDRVKSYLHRDVFYREANALVYDAILALSNKAAPIDIVTVSEELAAQGTGSDMGGPSYIIELTSYVASSANLEYHCLIIKEHYLKRKETEMALILVKDINSGMDVLDAQSKHTKAREEIMTGFFPTQEVTLKTVDALTPIVKAMESDELQGVPTGYHDLDEITAGWQASDLIILGAFPGCGKTSLMLCYGLAAAKNGHPVGLISLEMSAVQLKQRLFSIASGISASDQRSGNISQDEFNKLLDVNAHFEDLPIHFNEDAFVLHEILAALRRMVNDGVKIVFIDYLQLITDNTYKGNNRNNEIGIITRSLKLAAKKLNIPIIVGSQLSRPQKGAAVKIPTLRDLRDSGNIEQDADIVHFIHRPSYFQQEEIDNGELTQDEIELAQISIAKHRNGSLELLRKRWIGQYTRFEDWERKYQDHEELPPYDNRNLPRGDESGDVPF